jgi:enoyl-CoA hydratase/carnithine racemase
MSYSDIIYDKSDRIATITMNRPDKLNAWTPRMGSEMREAFTDADRDDAIRAIIVTGAGRAYCAGADMEHLNNIAEGASPSAAVQTRASSDKRVRPDFDGPFSYVLALSKPVIGAINGPCAGLGFTTSLYHDIRIASENARMGLILVQRGLAMEHGSSWMLPRLVGVAKAIELAVTGRLVDAQEALSIGLVHRVVPAAKLIETAREIATQIATKCAPMGVALAKNAIYEHLFTDLATAIRDEDSIMERTTRSADFKEAVKAFVEKRPARFTGR